MRAAVLTEFNKDWDPHRRPRSAARAGAGRLSAFARSGMCGTDLHAHHGHLGAKLPIVLGHEPAGEIVELGAGVLDLKVGDRVGVFWNQKGCGRCAVCQSGRPGALPERAELDAPRGRQFGADARLGVGLRAASPTGSRSRRRRRSFAAGTR